jgi:hypothetical protein
MTNGILHLHLLMALIFLVALWRSRGSWPYMAAAVGVILLLSGAYNFMTRMEGAPRFWHMFVGIKILMGLHAITMSFLLARGMAPADKMARWRKGALGSAALALLIGLYLSNFARG